MRAIWKGAITFGLVNVPVKLYSATEDHDVGLHQVHDADGGRIRYQRRCEVCGKVVEYAHIDKAYAEGSTTVVLTEEDLKSLPEERSREIEVVEFVPSEQIDPIMFDRSYFLEPDKTAVKAYALLRRTLEETDRTAIVQFSLRQKTRLGALRPRDKVLMLQSLLWDDEVREADFASLERRRPGVGAGAEDGVLAGGQHGDRLRPGQVQRRVPGAAAELIAAKLEQGDALDTAATFGEEGEKADEAEVVDLMEALRQSVERNRAARKAPAKKAAAKTGAATARRAPAKKIDGQEARRRRSRRRRPSSHQRPVYSVNMGIGIGIVLIVLGAIFLFALNVDIPFFTDDTLGIILIVAGVIALVLALVHERAAWTNPSRPGEPLRGPAARGLIEPPVPSSPLVTAAFEVRDSRERQPSSSQSQARRRPAGARRAGSSTR